MRRIALLLLLISASFASANAPVASYIFPAGGQRGAKVNVKVGGLFLYEKCGFQMLGPGVTAPSVLTRTKTLWFEGPLLPLPDSQRQEDYPKDMAGQIGIAADAPLGFRYWRLWTSQGATGSMKFVVGDLPEIVENEIDGDPIPVGVKLPVTINGRIFPREDVDVYSFSARKGQSVRCEVNAARLGSPLDARLEVRDAQGRRLAESEVATGDPVLKFTAPADGEYRVHIDDIRAQGGQAFVYRLTITADPFIEQIFPLGGRRGSTFLADITGQAVPAKAAVTIPQDALTEFPFLLTVAGKKSNAFALDVDEYPEYVAPRHLANLVELPAVLNGRIEAAGQVDEWKWQGEKGEVVEFELRAARLGSKLDGVLTIVDAGGKQLARAEANPADPALSFNVPADGEYRVRVQDRFHSRGGPGFAYRLRAAPPSKLEDFRLVVAGDVINLPRKGTAKLKLTAERIGRYSETIQLDIQGLPKDVTFKPTTIQSYGTAIDLTFSAGETAAIGVSPLTIVGRAKVGGRVVERTAHVKSTRGVPEPASVVLAIPLKTPFVIKGEYDMGFAARGAVHKRKYKIERNGFEGPIEVSLADRQARHLQGVEAPMIVVPAGVSEFTYSAFLPPWMETGRTCRVCVQGVGVIKEADGSEHRVSFSSVNQNEQLVAVVGPGMLALETERTSYRAVPGKPFNIAVKIQRGQGVEGPVTLELVTASHMSGLSAAKSTIAAKDERGSLTVTCADKLPGPFNMPVIVRATLMRGGEPVVAEVKLDVQP